MTNLGCLAMTLKTKPNHPNGKRFATIEEIEEKSKQARVLEVFRGLENLLA